MKSKLQIPTLAAILFLLVSLASALAQPAAPSAPAVNPATGRPAAAAGPAIDPAISMAVAEPEWIDPNWPDPALVLTNVSYYDLPLSEVASELRERFADDFDILPMPVVFYKELGNTTIPQQIKHVRASEVFNAMNLVFENDRTPLRWELKLDQANHALVQLRVLPEAAPEPASPQAPPQPKIRQVFFVGDLLDDNLSPDMAMRQLANTLHDIWNQVYPDDRTNVIQFHLEAQLIVCNGTPEQNAFIQQTLAALRQKSEWERSQQKSAGANSKPADAKSDLPSGSGGAK